MEKNATSIQQYLKYADDFEAKEPAIAMCCRLRYVEKFTEKKKKEGVPFSTDEKNLLGKVLQIIEKSKKELNLSKEDRQALVETFCSKQYAAVEKEERTVKKLTQELAMHFNTTADFLDLLSLFGPISKSWEEKRNYCILKASNIEKSLIAGEDVLRGHSNNPTLSKNLGKEEEKKVIPPIPKKEPEKPFDPKNPYNSSGKILKSHLTYYKIMGDAQKNVEYALKELQFENVEKAKQLIQNALNELDKVED